MERHVRPCLCLSLFIECLDKTHCIFLQSSNMAILNLTILIVMVTATINANKCYPKGTMNNNKKGKKRAK